MREKLSRLGQNLGVNIYISLYVCIQMEEGGKREILREIIIDYCDCGHSVIRVLIIIDQ